MMLSDGEVQEKQQESHIFSTPKTIVRCDYRLYFYSPAAVFCYTDPATSTNM